MANKYEWSIPPKKNTLFMGASHIVHAINDTLLENAINISLPSERYPFTFLKLLKILSNKENVITHIILECAPTDISRVADEKIFSINNEMIYFIPLFYPFFKEEEWAFYSKLRIEIFNILISHFYSNWALSSKKYFSQYGGFIENKNVFNGILNPDEIARVDDVKFVYNEINLKYLRKIINLCKENSIQLTFLYCPVYMPELYYDQQYYYEIIKNEFSEIELWDYSHLNIPVHYRADPHHLNEEGALYFTKIVEKDVTIQPISGIK
jgi:hypothetical protein